MKIGEHVMKKLVCSTLTLLSLALLSPLLVAQDGAETIVDDAARAERIARIQELRQLQREERELRRQEIQQRLEGLSEDERQALRERRRMQQQGRMRQGQRPRQNPRQRCPCPQAADATSEQDTQP